MGEKEGKRLLAKRLYLELRMYRYATLRRTKKEIYESSYKTELMAAIYEILLESLEYIKEDTANNLLWWNGGILEFLYEEWLKKEDSSFEELKAHIGAELRIVPETMESNGRKDRTDGKRIYQAA